MALHEEMGFLDAARLDISPFLVKGPLLKRKSRVGCRNKLTDKGMQQFEVKLQKLRTKFSLF